MLIKSNTINQVLEYVTGRQKGCYFIILNSPYKVVQVIQHLQLYGTIQTT